MATITTTTTEEGTRITTIKDITTSMEAIINMDIMDIMDNLINVVITKIRTILLQLMLMQMEVYRIILINKKRNDNNNYLNISS
jgi:hypothetical protein